MKTLRLTLTDLELGPLGDTHRVTGEAWARYTREVRTTDGRLVVLAQSRKTVPSTGVVEWQVLPNDDPTVHPDDQGFGIEVGWDLSMTKANPPGRSSLNPDRVRVDSSRVITVTTADPAVVAFAAKSTATPADPLVTYLTESAAHATFATKEEAAAGGITPAALAVQRLDRQNVSGQRAGGGVAQVAYTDAVELTKDWSDLSGWAAAPNAQVSGNRLYAVGTTNPGGALKSFPVAAGERAHISTLIYWKAGGSGAIYFGIDAGAADHAPVASSPDGAFIGFNGGNAKAIFSNLPGTETAVANGSNPTVDTTFACTIDIDETFVSFSMRAVGSASDFYSTRIARSTLVAAGKPINNISLFVTDSRGTSGHGFGPVVAVKSQQPTRTKTLGAQTVEGVEHRHIHTSPTDAGDRWRIAVPASYDPRKPAPVVIYFHQSLTGTQTSPWFESRAQPVSDALGDAGFIVAAANDGGDRWGNQASLDNYLALYSYIRDRFNTGALYYLGISMGSLPILNGLARGALPTPNAVATIGGVVNLDDLWANNTGSYAAGIRGAYGIASDGSDYATKTAGWNPTTRYGYEFRGVPMRLYTSTGDAAVPKATNQDALAAKVASYAPEAQVVLGTGGHLDPSQFQASDLLAFFRRYA